MITLPLSIINHPLFGDSLCVSGSNSATYIHSGLLHHPLAGLQLGADITAKLVSAYFVVLLCLYWLTVFIVLDILDNPYYPTD